MEWNKILRFSGGDARELIRGDLLIAEPLLREQFFNRAVILLLDVEKNSVMGLALNKRTNLYLSDIIPEWEGGAGIPLYCGGPVDTSRLFMLHTLGDIFTGSNEICPGIYVGGRLEDIIDYIEEGGDISGKIRFFLGYSGWDGDQLREERSEGVWISNYADNSTNLLSGSGNTFWRTQVKRLGPKFRSWLSVPQDPSMN
ncbi:MAG: YqgE/AlgH family protein [Bacteroidales bacterium]|nr:YqgE/AlgH family protein [Bacteroidales bacterium]